MLNKIEHWWKCFYTSDKIKGVWTGLIAHSGQISVGLSQGYSAVLVPKLLESNFATISEASWVASLGVVSNPLGAFLAGSLAEYFGRKSAIAIATLPHAIGWLLIALANNVTMLYIGRFVDGIGTGMANVIYLYITETVASDQRAWLSSSGPIFVSLGVLTSYTLGVLTNWKESAAISICLAIVTLGLCKLLPESPAWLIKKGKLNEAKASLVWLRGPGLKCDNEFNEIYQSQITSNNDNDDDVKNKNNYLKLLLVNRHIWKSFVILLLFFTLQQLSGIYIILFYAVNVITDIDKSINEYNVSVIIGIVRFIASILGAVLANFVGRKKLVLFSSIGMSISAIAVALSIKYNNNYYQQFNINFNNDYNYYNHYNYTNINNNSSDNNSSGASSGSNSSDTNSNSNNHTLSTVNNRSRTNSTYINNIYVPLIFIGAHVAFSMCGFLTLPWVMTSELYPLKFRSIMGGISTAIAQIISFVTIKTYPHVKAIIGFEMTMYIFSTAAVIGAIFSVFMLPETKGKTLEEIEKQLTRKNINTISESISKTIDIEKNLATNSSTFDKFKSKSNYFTPTISNKIIIHSFDNIPVDQTFATVNKNPPNS